MIEPAVIVLDFDGVVIDSVGAKTEAFAELFAEEKEHLPAILALHKKLGGVSRFKKFDLIYQDILMRPFAGGERDELGRRFTLLARAKMAACGLLPGSQRFLESYSRSMPLFIASGTPEEELQEIVAQRGLRDYFREVLGSPREKMTILMYIMRLYRIDPPQLLFVGDAWSDYEAARETEVRFLGIVASGNENPFPEDLDTFADLGALADRLNGCLVSAHNLSQPNQVT